MDTSDVERIENDGRVLAIIVRALFRREGIHFFTPDEFSQQLAYMRHPRGKIIPPHVHNPVDRAVQYTLEVLFIRRGELRVDFYTEQRAYVGSSVLRAGDTILLCAGGHGFEALSEIEMLEVKQGPYAGEADKTRFIGIAQHQVRTLPS